MYDMNCWSILMIAYTVIAVFILILLLFIYIEYKNEKKYQEERRKKYQDVKKPAKKTKTEPLKKPSGTAENIPVRKNLDRKKSEEKKPEPVSIPESKPSPTPEITIKIDLPEGNYPEFDHSRLLKMGLSEEEAKEFVNELIPQIETQIPLIKEAMDTSDFHTMERLTHSIKGSSMTIGTGGISDLLVDYNTYLKSGKELAIAEAYFKHLQHYCSLLKKQYS